MNLYIRQRIFSWTDSYDVYDETGEARYEVRGALFSLGHQIHVYDKRASEGYDEVGCIRQKLFTFLPTFEIEIGGRVVGTIQKKLTFFRESYLVDFRGWDVDGDIMGWDYRVLENGRRVMSISKELFRFSDTYVLSFDHAANELPGLLLVLAIDAANCSHDD